MVRKLFRINLGHFCINYFMKPYIFVAYKHIFWSIFFPRKKCAFKKSYKAYSISNDFFKNSWFFLKFFKNFLKIHDLFLIFQKSFFCTTDSKYFCGGPIGQLFRNDFDQCKNITRQWPPSLEFEKLVIFFSPGCLW